MGIEAKIESWNLDPLFSLACLAGMFLAVYLMQLTWHDHESRRDGFWLRHARRIAHLCLSLAFLYAVQYGARKGWQPWPPFVAIALSIDLMLLVRILSIRSTAAAIVRAGVQRPQI